MVNLKYIKNPFTDDCLYSFDCFSKEKNFYDCIGHTNIKYNDVFENLGSSFYTYLLVGDNEEWIGYILFHNAEYVNSYIKTVQSELKKLLSSLIGIVKDKKILEDIYILLKDLNNNQYNKTTELSRLEKEIKILNSRCRQENEITSICFNEYNNNIFNYLYSFDEYYYLDIVIGLPLDTKTEEVESKYYGFISETYSIVEKIIRESFYNIPIILKNTNSTICIIDSEESKIKILDKKDIAKN